MKEFDKKLLTEMVWNQVPLDLYEGACDILEWAYKRLADEYFYEAVDAVVEELENWLIPNYRRWEMMQAYQTPDEANFERAYDAFLQDLIEVFDRYVCEMMEEVE